MPQQLSLFPKWVAPPEPGSTPGPSVPLGEVRGVARFGLPCRTVLNRCQSDRMPFRWTLNPYRGCEFGCTYCYARYSHEFLGLPKWTDFQDKILVKRKAPECLTRDLHRLRNSEEPIAMGTVTDPYQPAEKEFQVTRRMLQVLARKRGLDLSITTKSALILRDLDLLGEIASRSRLRINVSLITLDRRIARLLEPRASTPARRLETIRRLAGAGLRVGVFVMPVMPGLTDSQRAMEALVRRCAEAGTSNLHAQVLFLRESARRGFLPRLARDFPALAGRYRREYGRYSSPSPEVRERVEGMVAALKEMYGLGAATSGPCVTGPRTPAPASSPPAVLPLLAPPGAPASGLPR